MLVRNVRVVRMAMCQRCVGVIMRVRFALVPIEIVYVLAALVVYVAVCMRYRLVGAGASWRSVKCNHTPAPISPAASQNMGDA